MDSSGDFGGKLRSLRKKSGFSVNKLSEISGVNPGTLSRLERELQKPTFPNIQKLARGLNIPPETLMEMAGYISDSSGAARDFLSNSPSEHGNSQEQNLELRKELEELALEIKASFGELTRRLDRLDERLRNHNSASSEHDELPEGDHILIKEVSLPAKACEIFSGERVIGEDRVTPFIARGATHKMVIFNQNLEPFLFDGATIYVSAQNFVSSLPELVVATIKDRVVAVRILFARDGKVGLGISESEAQWFDEKDVKVHGVVVNIINPENCIKEFAARTPSFLYSEFRG